MVVQVFADAVELDTRFNAELAQVARRADSGAQQDCGRAYGAGARDDLPVNVDTH